VTAGRVRRGEVGRGSKRVITTCGARQICHWVEHTRKVKKYLRLDYPAN
jgi:hypothetical protein